MADENSGKVLVIFGPLAVGKMTVGQELAKITDFYLLHAHMIFDLVTPLFPGGTEPFHRLAGEIQRAFVREAIGANRNLILTWVWDFDDPRHAQQIERLDEYVSESGGRTYCAELQAPLATRVERNATPNRRANKKLDWSTREYLTEWDREHRTSSDGECPYPDRHILIDNTDLDPAEAARRIQDHFGFRDPAER